MPKTSLMKKKCKIINYFFSFQKKKIENVNQNSKGTSLGIILKNILLRE